MMVAHHELTADDLEPLWDLANGLAEDAESAKSRHHRDTWEYGQALGYEKASDELASRLRVLESKLEADSDE